MVITAGQDMPGEAAKICRLLDSGTVWRVHVRKPGWPEDAVRRLLEQIPQRLRRRISIHDHHHLAAETGIGGVHLNSRNPYPPDIPGLIVSRSCHSLAELAVSDTDYDFLSPVFDSISKTGYGAAFSAGELAAAAAGGIIGIRTLALGGVTPGRLGLLRDMGFGGAAMLGAVWREPFIHNFIAKMKNFPIDNFRLQLITDGATPKDHIDGALKALDGGCRWIQLRMKDATAAEIVHTAAIIGDMCRRYGATFIIDDQVELVEITGADGVHLGRNDMPVAQARNILGPAKIIGATTNTADELTAAENNGADYAGLGPFRYTVTKKNLSPLLGTDGYRTTIAGARAAGTGLPVVAIGGIKTDDIPDLLGAGAAGIAVSGAILKAEFPADATRVFINRINDCFHNIHNNTSDRQ